MNRCRFNPASIVCLAVMMILVPALAYGQGATTTAPLSGTVMDSSGGVLPGASIVVKNNANGAQYEAVTDTVGRFVVPALNPGTYTVKVSLSGFKSWTSPDVTVVTATPSNIKAVLEVGSLEETVVVTGATEIVQTQTTTVATTLGSKQIANLPLVTRNAVDFMTALPGVDTTGTIRSNTSVLGLNMNAMNITIDGVNVQDNYLKSSDGFFAVVRPTLDAVEEVTMTTAAQDAASAGQGAVQMRFVTRSGTNRFQGSVYHTLRNPAFNTAYWFNIRDLPPTADGSPFKDQVRVNKGGFREGGPIVIPGLFDGHDRAFFFFNWEKSWQPSTSARNRTILNPAALNGTFTYNVTGGTRSVDLLALAAKYGQTSTKDATIAQILADINRVTTQAGGITQLTDPNLQRFTFSNKMNDTFGGPTMRFDVNVTNRNRLGASLYIQKYIRDTDMLNSYDPQFPGFPVWGTMTRTNQVLSINLRSTFSSNMVNEAKYGWTGGMTHFANEVSKDQFSNADLANMDGYAVSLSAAGITSAYNINFNENRGSPVWSAEDTLNWIHNSHSISLGGTYTNIFLDMMDVNRVVPSLSLGVDSSDPASAMFTQANFPGASNTDLSNARGIYAVLTGRITAINGTAYLNADTGKYQYNGPLVQQARMREIGAFIQDAWRFKPYLTITGGLRYEVQLPFTPVSPTFSMPSSPDDLFGISGPGNLFKPGVMTGRTPTFVAYTPGTSAYKTDWNNLAPTVGAAWRPNVHGKLKKILGSDPVFRGGYSLAFMREGTASFTNMFSYNPGGSIAASRNMTVGNLVTNTGSDVLPVLFRDRNRLGPPAFANSPSYPLTGAVTDQLNVFDPNTTVPYTHSFSFGFQRTLSRNTAMEVRYVGTRSRDGWVYNNWNEVNILENGFLDEFKHAMANLQANMAAGRGTNFKYYGPNTGTYPLPIYLAYFSGVSAAQASDPSKYTSSLFSNSNFYNPLNPVNPNPYNPASSNSNYGLFGDATRRANALGAGLPANEFVVNPDLLGGVYKTYNAVFTSYDSVQFLVRRRLADGLQFEPSYVFAHGWGSRYYTLREPRENATNTSVPRHVFKANWVYELPFGQGKHWGSSVSRGMNKLVGGWSFIGDWRIQSGTIADLGNVRLVGMTDADLQNIYKLQFRYDPTTAKTRVFMWPQDVIDNSIKAWSVGPTGYTKGTPTGRYIAPPNGADCIQVVSGDCAPRHHWVTGPAFVRFDMSIAKRIDLTRTVAFDLRVDALNVFNNTNFYQVTIPSTSNITTASYWEVSSAYKDINNTQDPGGRLLQIVSRISW